jgi:hypothetical protein
MYYDTVSVNQPFVPTPQVRELPLLENFQTPVLAPVSAQLALASSCRPSCSAFTRLGSRRFQVRVAGWKRASGAAILFGTASTTWCG